MANLNKSVTNKLYSIDQLTGISDGQTSVPYNYIPYGCAIFRNGGLLGPGDVDQSSGTALVFSKGLLSLDSIIVINVTAMGFTLGGFGISGYAKIVNHQSGSYVYSVDSGTANTYVGAYTPAISSISDGMVLRIRAANANTAASTFTPNSGVVTAYPIVGGDHSALGGGEIGTNSDLELQWNSSISPNGAWVLLSNSNGYAKALTPAKFDNSNKLATTSFVQQSLGNYSSVVSVTGTTTLTLAQAGAFVEITSGSGITVTLPIVAAGNAGVGYTLYNNTSNTVTVAAGSGNTVNLGRTNTTTFIIPAGSNAEIVTDGASWEIFGDVMLPYSAVMSGTGFTTPAQFDNSTKLATTAFVQRASGNYSSASPVSSTAYSIPASSSGQFIVAGSIASAGTWTLPLLSSTTVGSSIRILNLTGYSLTINPSGADKLIGAFNVSGTASNFSIPNGTEVSIINYGLWAVVGTADLGGANDSLFSSSVGSPGYQKLPSGLIIQWGSAATNSSGNIGGAWPIAFSTGLLSCSAISTGANVYTVLALGSTTNYQFNGYISTTGAAVGSGVGIDWIAMGH